LRETDLSRLAAKLGDTLVALHAPGKHDQRAHGLKGGQAALDNLISSGALAKTSEADKSNPLTSESRAALKKAQSSAASAWSPSMSRKDADAWAKDSAIKGDVFHASSSKNTSSLKREGFNVKKASGEGAVYAKGIYTASDKASVARYAKTGTDTLTLRVNAKNPFTATVKSTINPGLEVRTQILEATGPKGRNAFRQSLTSRGLPDPGKRAARYVDDATATTAALKASGHDALIIKGATQAIALNPAVGGNQVLAFDPKQVVIVSG
jgi:hypothetical protein